MKKILTKLVAIIILIALGTGGYWYYKAQKQKPNTTLLTQLLEESSELTTAKLTITGVHDYHDSGTKFLNKSDFTMAYKATVKAGIDISQVVIETNDIDTIYVTIPEAQILEVKVDPSSIKYYDVKFALANKNSKEDSNLAIMEAEEQAKETAKESGVLELANQQSEILIKGILANAIPNGYHIEKK